MLMFIFQCNFSVALIEELATAGPGNLRCQRVFFMMLIIWSRLNWMLNIVNAFMGFYTVFSCNKMNESRANRWQTTIWSRISLKSALCTVGENDFVCVRARVCTFCFGPSCWSGEKCIR